MIASPEVTEDERDLIQELVEDNPVKTWLSAKSFDITKERTFSYMSSLQVSVLMHVAACSDFDSKKEMYSHIADSLQADPHDVSSYHKFANMALGKIFPKVASGRFDYANQKVGRYPRNVLTLLGRAGLAIPGNARLPELEEVGRRAVITSEFDDDLKSFILTDFGLSDSFGIAHLSSREKNFFRKKCEPMIATLGSAVLSGPARRQLFEPTLRLDDYSWQRCAASPNRIPCTSDPDIFFIDDEDSGQSAYTEQAKALCSHCPIQSDCLQTALSNDEPFGIWGGLTRDERKLLQSTQP